MIEVSSFSRFMLHICLKIVAQLCLSITYGGISSTKETKSLAPCFVIASALRSGWRLSFVYPSAWYDHVVPLYI